MTALRSLAAASIVLATLAACGGGSPPTPNVTPTRTPTSQPTAGATPTSAATPTTGAGETDAPTGSPTGVVLPELARIASGETPSGWQELRSSDGACRMAVPSDWDTTTMAGTAIAPAFGGQASISNDPVANWGSWEDYINTMQTVFFGPDKLVLAENDELFVMAAGPSSADGSVLVGTNRGETVCGVLMIIQGNAIPDLLATGYQVLYSLAATD